MVPLDRYTLEGVVWGRETLWLTENGAFAAAVTRAGGLTFEGVREDLAEALPTLAALAAKEAVGDLGRIARDMKPLVSGSYALVGANVVDGTGGAGIPDATVLVRDGRIEAVGPGSGLSIPADVPKIDLRGKTILPGLWDMHTHVTQIEWGPVYLAAGVTTVRDMGNESELILALRDALASGEALGPRLLLAGLVDGGGPNAFGTVAATTPGEGRAVVRRYHDEGFHQMKLYSFSRGRRCRDRGRSASTGHERHRARAQLHDAPAGGGGGMDHIAHLAVRDEPGSEELRRTTELLRGRDGLRSDALVGSFSDRPRPPSLPSSRAFPGFRRRFGAVRQRRTLKSTRRRARRLERGLRSSLSFPRRSADRRRHR
jgi:hypothetical protein